MQTQASEPIRNVILMIGDGMGPQQIGLLESYARLAPNSIYQGQPTAMSTFMKQGKRLTLSMTHPEDAIVVDSACSATHLATGGMPSAGEVIGIDAQGYSRETVLEKSMRLGKATGLVTDTRMTHGTPGAFASHVPHRSMENAMAVQMMELGPDVLLGGGIRAWIPKSVNDKGDIYNKVRDITGDTIKIKSKRKDDRNLLLEAQENGYQLAFNRNQLGEIEDGKVLGLFAYSGMMDGIAYTASKQSKERVEPSLKEMTIKALDILSQDPDGFFLMVEGGQIDWAGHRNDVAYMLHELLKFDEAIAAVHDWVKDRDDTLVVITADHETGAFGFSYKASDLPKAEKREGPAFANRDYKPNFNFGPLNLLDKIYNQKVTYKAMLAQFNKLDKAEQKPSVLAKIISDNTGFTVTPEQGKRILETVPNPNYDPEHSYMKNKTVPKIDEFYQSFNVYHSNVETAVIGRVLAEQQNVVWGTGTHTSTPVAVIAWGPESITDKFTGMLHQSDVGQILMDSVTN